MDPDGLWRKVSKYIYEATKDGETLEELAELITYGEPENWVCIWPIKDKALWKKYPIAKKCARANVKNLITEAKDGENVKMRQSYNDPGDGFMVGLVPFWGRSLVWKSGKHAGELLAKRSKQGGSPIGFLAIGGHCYGDESIGKNEGDSNIGFKASDLFSAAQEKKNDHNTYASSVKKIGPPRCWFTRKARIYGFACNSHPVWSNDWANTVVRKTANVFGATGLVYTYDPKTPQASLTGGKNHRNLKSLVGDPNWNEVGGTQ